MLDQDRIDQIVKDAAAATLGSGVVQSVRTSSMVDFEGTEALRIRITLTEGSTNEVRSAALKALSEIHDRLQKEGEERFPIIEYDETRRGAS